MYNKIRLLLLSWYDENKQAMPWRDVNDPYKIWLSEIMLQQTQVKTVIGYYNNWIDRFPTIKSVANADQDEILSYWQGLGYYSRALNFHISCKMLVNSNYVIPNNIDDFMKLKGVGPYIASAVMSIAFNHKVGVVDGNVNRFISRLNAYNIEPIKNRSNIQNFVNTIVDKNRPGDFNQAMMDFGRNICKPTSPLCNICPLSNYCIANQDGLVDYLPVKSKKKIKPHYDVVVGMIWNNDKILITKRKENGLLGGLWEFPGGKIKKNENVYKAIKREIMEELSITVQTNILLDVIKHQYSHFKVTISAINCFYIKGDIKLNGPCDYRWIKPKDINKYPFPKSSMKLFHTIGVEHV